MVLSFLLYFYCRNHNLLTVGFMPVPPGHRQQITSTISAIELYMEAEIVIKRWEILDGEFISAVPSSPSAKH